jgi:hypothetical protein
LHESAGQYPTGAEPGPEAGAREIYETATLAYLEHAQGLFKKMGELASLNILSEDVMLQDARKTSDDHHAQQSRPVMRR